MLSELNDGHNTLTADFFDGQEYFRAAEPNKFEYFFYSGPRWAEEETDQFLKRIDSTLIDNGFQIPISNIDEVAFYYNYARSDNFLYLSTGMYHPQLKILSKLIKENTNLEGIILDLRSNRGGNPGIARKMAGKFTSVSVQGDSIRFKKKKKFGALKKNTIRPIGFSQFTKPVIVLTSNATASTTEVFLLGVKDLPNVTILGESTEGIISSIRTFKLPNKWKVTLSVNQTYSSDMICYEGVGIPPHVESPYTDADLKHETDIALLKSIGLLNEKIMD
jgi:hypothetical protein